MTAADQPPRAAVGGPADSGKTALMEQHCNRLRLDAIVAFLRAKGGLNRLRSERGAAVVRALFRRVGDIKMAKLGTSGAAVR
jgi:hypothetical protein